MSETTDMKTFIHELGKISPDVKTSREIFKQFYRNGVRGISLTDIINGESIEIHQDNLNIEVDLQLPSDIDEELFERRCELGCTRNLYDYQKNAIKMLRILEYNGYVINPSTKRKIISNGWQLSLPVGSGKSLVFLFLAIYFRSVPAHPIYVSMDGSNIPLDEAIELKFYPYYYEQCGYVEDEANVVVACKEYPTRKCTVILTHSHLMEQIKHYIQTDFPIEVSRSTKIEYVYNMRENRVQQLFGGTEDRFDILIVCATEENVKMLSIYSWTIPFMRVIIDDYTGMGSIGNFKQILASSTIYVSGSGYSKDNENIPVSYYTLKYTPTSEMSCVGDPRSTLVGVHRDNIACIELLGSSCKFNRYEFISECEDTCRGIYNATPNVVYPPINKHKFLSQYLTMKYLLNNIDRFKTVIGKVEIDSIRPRTDKPDEMIFDMNRAQYYTEWKKELYSSVNVEGTEYNSPLIDVIYHATGKCNLNSSRGNCVNGVVQQECYACKEDSTYHNDFGMISRCCGAFFCYKCLKQMTTKTIYDSSTGNSIINDHSYYCCCCRATEPTYLFNVLRQKDTNLRSSILARKYMDMTDLNNLNSTEFDYSFYMFLNGFKPIFHEGKYLNISVDIELGDLNKNWYNNGVPKLECVLPADQLAMLSIGAINETLAKFSIMPHNGCVILMFKCPHYMHSRVRTYHSIISSSKDTTTMVSGIQPISRTQLEFHSDIDSLIGVQKNLIGIIVWDDSFTQSDRLQTIGRLYRINSYNNRLSFYVTTNKTAYE